MYCAEYAMHVRKSGFQCTPLAQKDGRLYLSVLCWPCCTYALRRVENVPLASEGIKSSVCLGIFK